MLGEAEALRGGVEYQLPALLMKHGSVGRDVDFSIAVWLV